jgi:hypothetical protein
MESLDLKKKHFDNAEFARQDKCPISLALQEKFGGMYLVTYYGFVKMTEEVQMNKAYMNTHTFKNPYFDWTFKEDKIEADRIEKGKGKEPEDIIKTIYYYEKK